MLRFVYRSLLRLHPARFRGRFAEEMLAIFDDAAKQHAEVGLLADVIVSLARQWTLRSAYWEENAVEPTHATTNGVPVFYTFESFKPRTSALIDGGVLTIIVFYAVCLVLRYTWTHPVFMPFKGIQFQDESTVNRLERSSSLLSVGATAVNPTRRSASAEFGGKSPNAALLPPGTPTSPQSRAQATLSDTPTQGQSGTAVPAHPAIAAAIRSYPQSSVRATPPSGLSEETLRSFAGMYAPDSASEFDVLITSEDGQLKIEITGESKCALIPVSEMKFVVSGPTNTSIEFVRDHDGGGYALNIYRDGHVTHYTKD